jgi:hypothetical protein
MATSTHDRMVCEHIPIYLDNVVLAECPNAWPGAFDQLYITPSIDNVVGAHFKGMPIAKFLPTDPKIIARLYDAMFVNPLNELFRTSCLDWRDDATMSTITNIAYVANQQPQHVIQNLIANNELAELPSASAVGVIMADSFQEWFHRGSQQTVHQGNFSIRWYTVCFSGIVRQPTAQYKGEKMQFVSPHGSVAKFGLWNNVR